MSFLNNHKFINIYILIISCLISFVLLEIILRFYNPTGPRLRGDKIILPISRNYRYTNTEVPGLDRIILHKKNSLGFRGDEPPKDFAKYLTIIAVGGSTTECALNSEGKTWEDLLKIKLTKDFKLLWLNNAGICGHSTFGHLVLMDNYIIKLKPKVVLFLVGINDVGSGDLNDYDAEHLGKVSFRSLKGIYKGLSGHSEILSLGLNFYRYLLAKRGLSADSKLNLKGMGQIEFDNKYCETFKLLHKQKYIPNYENRLIKLVHISRQNGIEPVFITQPIIFGDAIDSVTNVDLGKIRIDDTMNGKLFWNIMELYNDSVRLVALRENVFIVDLAKQMPKSSLYFYDTEHYTNNGAEKVAEILYADLSPFLAARFEKWKLSR
jgi:hypothetical protein